MKTITNLSVLMYVLLNSTLIFSQDYIKFPEEGSAWTVKNSWCGSSPCEVTYYEYLYYGDTIINEKKFNIIKEGNRYNYVYDTNKVVYVYGPLFDDTIMLYNFNLTIGDEFFIEYEIFDSVPFYVVEKDSLMIENTYRTILKLANDPLDPFVDTLTWVEGIGSEYGPIYPITLPGFEWTYALTCYQKGDINIYGECVKVGINNELIKNKTYIVKPNPVLGYSIIEPVINNEYIIEIYNCNGILHKKEKITGKYTIRKSDFKQGIYKYRIIYKKTFYTGSFVIL